MTDSNLSSQEPFEGAPGAVSTDGSFSVLIVDDSAVDRQVAGSIVALQTAAEVYYASDGSEALNAIPRLRPDLVLTDLQMPVVDGLALVEQVRQRHPLVPTIVMTAHGSEETAVEALRRGAASYVPKRFLARMLPATLLEVLAASRVNREQLRLQRCWTSAEFAFELENDAALIAPLVSHLQHYRAQVVGSNEAETVRLGVALHEALTNAIYHGNLELSSELREVDSEGYYREATARRFQRPYADRRVRFSALETPGESRYVIRDDGNGFDTSTAVYNADDPEHLQRSWGRGLFLIRMFMDDVQFNAAGNEITLQRYWRQAEVGEGLRLPLECLRAEEDRPIAEGAVEE